VDHEFFFGGGGSLGVCVWFTLVPTLRVGMQAGRSASQKSNSHNNFSKVNSLIVEQVKKWGVAEEWRKNVPLLGVGMRGK